METYKGTKMKVNSKKKLITILVLLITLFTILTGVSNFIASNKSYELLQTSTTMNTYLLTSFTDRLRSFNSEFELLSNMCNSQYNESLLSNYKKEIYNTDDEFTISQFMRWEILGCPEALNQLQWHFRGDSIAELNTSISLNYYIHNKIKGYEIWNNLSYLSTFITLLLIVVVIFLNMSVPNKEF
jgi:hypothetical protein